MNKKIIISLLIIMMISTSVIFAEENTVLDLVNDTINTALSNTLDTLDTLMRNLSELIKITLSKFKDIKATDWFIDTVSKLVGIGGIDGYQDGTFRPNKEISKAEFTKILLSTIGYKQEDSKNGHWAVNYISKAEELKILDRNEFKKEDLNKPIKRYEAAKMIAKTLELIGEKKVENPEDFSILIKDYNLNSSEYKDYVLQVYGKGIITGYKADNTFRADRSLTRAEASTIIMRVIDQTERDIPQRPEMDSSWIEPEFEVFYTTDMRNTYDYFQIRVANRQEYIEDLEKGLYKNYIFSTECISPKEINVLENYSYLSKNWNEVSYKKRYSDVKINAYPAGKIYSLEDMRRSRYLDTKKEVELKEGQELKYKITVSNGRITKEYTIKAEFRDKQFRY